MIIGHRGRGEGEEGGEIPLSGERSLRGFVFGDGRWGRKGSRGVEEWSRGLLTPAGGRWGGGGYRAQ